jgi:glyoxylase-like metal-dependent hydrolase (beta-lactamase superfamily II)
MAEVKVLVKGYTSEESGEEKTCATVSLVKDKDIVMVVDPGVLESQQILIDALENEGLSIEDVNIVCITHSHLDHYRNVGMFPDAKVLEFYGLWDKNTVDDWEEQFSENIRIIKTPGHSKTAITLLVKTDKGVVAVCSDVFWKENFPESPEQDEYADEPEKLKQSRKKVLELADWIVPGHDDMYEVKK